MTLRVGLTGGIGSGKSYIAGVFSTLGIKVFNADERAGYLLDNSPAVRKELEALFGRDIYISGKLDRKTVAGRVFADKGLLERMNSVVHPAVFELFRDWVGENTDQPYLIKEAAIIYESGADRELDLVINVNAPVEIRLERVLARDGGTGEEVRARMDKQLRDESRWEKADFNIINDGKELLLPQVVAIHNKLLLMDAGKKI